MVPDAITVVGVADASPNTVQAYDAAGPPPYAQFQVGCAEVEPCTPANENDVSVTVGASTGGTDETGGMAASTGVPLYSCWITMLDTSAGFPGGGTKENVEGPVGINPDKSLFVGRATGTHGFTVGRT